MLSSEQESTDNTCSVLDTQVNIKLPGINHMIKMIGFHLLPKKGRDGGSTYIRSTLKKCWFPLS